MYPYKPKPNQRIKKLLYVFLFSLFLVGGTAFALRGLTYFKTQTPADKTIKPLPTMSASELKAYDGTQPGKPIYVGFEGKVYDVSAGQEYYQAGGAYHFLAGKDSTADLRVFGGEILQRKYPVVAKLKP